MHKHTLAKLVLVTSLTGVAACRDASPQIITVPAAELEKPGIMNVTGTATLEVSPDCADLTMTISADGARPAQATAGVQDKQRDLVASLRAIGLEDSDIKLSYLNLTPIYVPARDGFSPPHVATYRAEVTVTATTKRFDKISVMMEAGASAGVSTMSSQLRRSDLAELKKRVRDMALGAAKDKAAQVVHALGIELGRVVSVVESSNGAMWGSPYFPQPNANAVEVRSTPGALGGALQPLTLEITIGFQLTNKA